MGPVANMAIGPAIQICLSEKERNPVPAAGVPGTAGGNSRLSRGLHRGNTTSLSHKKMFHFWRIFFDLVSCDGSKCTCFFKQIQTYTKLTLP